MQIKITVIQHFCILGLQNHRKDQVGRELLRLSTPPSCWEKDQLKQIAQDRIQLGFDYLQGWSLHSLSGNLLQCLITLV